jgi:hypothetical protein
LLVVIKIKDKNKMRQDIKIVKTKLGYRYKITAYEYSNNEHIDIKLWDYKGDIDRLTKEDAILDAKEDLKWLLRGINPKAGKKYFKGF